jgi:ribonucleotide reductase alpha subunit
MGLANILMLLKMPYSSKEANEFTSELIRYLTMVSMDESVNMTIESGIVYEVYDQDTYLQANRRFFESEFKLVDFDVKGLKDKIIKHGIKNSCASSQAPTGTISFIADVSGGIEPVFALKFTRNIEKGSDENGNRIHETVTILDSTFESIIDEISANEKEKKEIIEYMNNHEGSVQGCPNISKQWQEIFKTSNELSVDDHLNIMEAVCKNISLSVSKTINLPESATVEDVSNAYIKAKDIQAIGVTVYRDKSLDAVLNTIKKKNPAKYQGITDGKVYHFVINKISYYIAAGFEEGQLNQIFAGLNHNEEGEIFIPKSVVDIEIKRNSSGNYTFIDKNTKKEYKMESSHTNPETESMTRLISKSLRYGMPVEEITQQLEKTKGSLNSFTKVILRFLKRYIKTANTEESYEPEKCPKCGTVLKKMEGCIKCIAPDCGFSKCG